MTVTRLAVRRRRRGAILLVVLALLALFAVIGLSFVLYAESEATASRIARERKSNNVAKDGKGSPTSDRGREYQELLDRAAGLAITQLTWGTTDTASVFRGHDLATLMYGDGGSVPYNGVGLFHEQLDNTAATPPLNGLTTRLDRADVVNFSLYKYGASSATWTIVDPEYTQGNGNVTVGPFAAYNGTDRLNLLRNNATAINPPPASPPSFTYVAKNAPYTYPDRNNLMVGLMDPNTGQVVVPSGHRPNLFGSLDPSANDNWFSSVGRFKMLRPRRVDNLTSAEITQLGGSWPPTTTNAAAVALRNVMTTTGVGAFPYPTANPDGSVTGDVQNLKFAGGVQRNDSVWLDAGLPTQDYKGRRVAPLVAIALLPLDGRVNLNAAGNLVAGKHQSAAGFGPHEINPAWLSALVAGGANPLTTPAAGPNASINAQAFTFTRFGSNAVTTTPNTPAGVSQRYFQPAGTNQQVPPPSYAPVPWDGVATGAPSYAPATATQSVPDYATAGYSPNTANFTNHPTLWNPYQRTAFATSDPNPTFGPNSSRAYPLTDLRLFAGRFSGKAIDYESQTFLANDYRARAPVVAAFQNEFLGNGTVALGTPPGSQGSGPLSPGNRTRNLVTPVSNSLAVPGLGYNWTGSQLLTLAAGQTTPSLTALPTFDTGTLPAATSVPLGDERARAAGAQTRLQNLRAGLSGIDLNRPLADYRVDLTQPLSSTNAANSTQATTDRQALAKDIFLRLAVATGAKVGYDQTLNFTGYYGNYVLPVPSGGSYSITINSTPVNTITVSQQEYDALRWLAQLAANMVDYLDSDDVSTTFVWNPTSATSTNPTDTGFAAQFSTTDGPPSSLSQRVVYGTEKPRLILNELHAEIANRPADATSGGLPPYTIQDFEVRFFLELLNPGNDEPAPAAATDAVHPLALEYPAAPLPPAGRGAVSLTGYQVEVYDNDAFPVNPRDGSSTKRDSVLLELRQADNVTGAAPTATAPTAQKIVAPLNGLTLANAANPAQISTTLVEPNNGRDAAFKPAGTGRNGFAVVGPTPGGAVTTRTANDKAFFPDPAENGNPAAGSPLPAALRVPGVMPAPGTPSPTLAYRVAGSSRTTLDGNASPLTGRWNQTTGRHTVLLRRLANPYQPAGPQNPYVTVDYQTQVKVADVVFKTTDAIAPPPAARAAVGRLQPYAGGEFADVTPVAPAAAPTTFLVEAQTNRGANDPKHTFFQHNCETDQWPAATPAPAVSDRTLNLPFQWLAHLDRSLVSPAELLFVGASKPHELTRQFGRPNTAGNPLYHRHDLQHQDTTSTAAPYQDGPLYARDAAGTNRNSPLYRALDLLQVKPWMTGLPVGGRQPGKVNINMLWDESPQPTATPAGTGRSRVFDAVMDKQLGNAFTDTTVAPATTNDLETIWKAIKATRSPSWTGTTPQVGNTFDETGTGDRPFKGLGTALFGTPTAPPPGQFPATLPNGGGLDDTILRLRNQTTPTPGDGRPLFTTAAAGSHPMQDWEPLRKAFNSFSTTTDSYVLLVTVGFFEVVEETVAGQPTRILRQEAYDDAPGDLRGQFVAVLDRTNLGAEVKEVLAQTAGQPLPQAAQMPWVLELQNAVALPSPLTNPVTLTVQATGVTGLTTANAAVTGVYDGAAWTISAGTQPSQFFVGSGDQQNLLLAANPTTWTYDATAGTATIQATYVTGLPASLASLATPRAHAAGEMLSNVVFRNPGPQPGKTLTPGKTDPVVRMFAELK